MRTSTRPWLTLIARVTISQRWLRVSSIHPPGQIRRGLTRSIFGLQTNGVMLFMRRSILARHWVTTSL